MTANASPWNRICLNFLTIHILAFGTVNSWTGFSENLCKKKHVQSHLQVFHLQTIAIKPFQVHLQHLARHNCSAGTVFARTYVARVSASSPSGAAEVPQHTTGKKSQIFHSPETKLAPLTITSSAFSTPGVFHHQHPTQFCVRNNIANNISDTFFSLKKPNKQP